METTIKALSVFVMGLAIGCGSSSDDTGTTGGGDGVRSGCTAGDTQSCECSDGSMSTQTCSGGTFGACECAGGGPGTDLPTTPDGLVITDPNNPGIMPCENLDSGFEGDEVCILPPPDASIGTHLHTGPTDYDDPDQIAEFIMGPGDESTECYYLITPNLEPTSFYEQFYRMRPGSHHLIMNLVTDTAAPRVTGWRSCRELQGVPWGGSQRSVSNFPPGGVIPPEDEKLARPLPAESLMYFEEHFVNSSDQPILREVWVNLMTRDIQDAEVMGGLFMLGGLGMNVPPGATEVLVNTCEMADQDRRIISIFGHRHANTDRFTVFLDRNGERTLVYEDYNWEEPAELMYNSVIENPAPDRATLTSGGFSGILALQPGDTVTWECEVNNRQDVTLNFGNEVYTGDMCNVFGTTSSFTGSPIWFCAGG